MKLKAAIFDLDGTLLNTLEDLYIVMNRVLKMGNYPTITKEDVRHFIGNGAREFMIMSLPKNARDKENVDKFLHLYHLEYDKATLNTSIYHGIAEFLKKLNDKNIPIAILSNKPHPATEKVINEFFQNISFKIILGQKEEFKAKPDTKSALFVADCLGFKPQDIAFIGDGDADAKTAINGGFYQAAVLWGYRTKQELIQAGAKNFYSTPTELEKLFF